MKSASYATCSGAKTKKKGTPSLKIQNVHCNMHGDGLYMGQSAISSAVSLHGNISKEELLKIRMQQRDICYVAGLPQSVCTRQTLASKQWFGQFGKIQSISITDNQNCIRTNWMCVHIKYLDTLSAAKAVKGMNHKKLDDGRVLEANYGTQRYCEFFINNKKCHKHNCPFRHSWCQLTEVVNFNQPHQIAHAAPSASPKNVMSNYSHSRPHKTSLQQQPPPQPQQQQQRAELQGINAINIQQQPTMSISSAHSSIPTPPHQQVSNNNNAVYVKQNEHANNNQQQQLPQIRPSTQAQSSMNSVPSTYSSTDLLLKENAALHSDENATNSGANYVAAAYHGNDQEDYLQSVTKSINGDEMHLDMVHQPYEAEPTERNEEKTPSQQRYGDEDEEDECRRGGADGDMKQREEEDLDDEDERAGIIHEQEMEMRELYEEVDMLKQANYRQNELISSLRSDLDSKEAEIVKLQKVSKAFASSHSQIQQQNKLLSDRNQHLSQTINELQQQMAALQQENANYLKEPEQEFNLLDYTLWQSNDVYRWIISIHGGRFQKYAHSLQKNIKLENVDGSLLKCLTTTDIHRWGVTDFKDKQILLESIKHLKSNILDIDLDAPSMYNNVPPPQARVAHNINMQNVPMDDMINDIVANGMLRVQHNRNGHRAQVHHPAAQHRQSLAAGHHHNNGHRMNVNSELR